MKPCCKLLRKSQSVFNKTHKIPNLEPFIKYSLIKHGICSNNKQIIRWPAEKNPRKSINITQLSLSIYWVHCRHWLNYIRVLNSWISSFSLYWINVWGRLREHSKLQSEAASMMELWPCQPIARIPIRQRDFILNFGFIIKRN